MPMPVSAITEAEVASMFPHAANDEIAQAFRLTVRQVQHIGTRHGLTKTAEARSRIAASRAKLSSTTLQALLLAALKAAGAAGLSKPAAHAAVAQATSGQVDGALYKLCTKQQAHRRGSKGRSTWHFGARPAAQATSALQPPAAPRTSAAVVKVPSYTAGPARTQGPAHIPAGIQIQRGAPVPGPEARWHANAQPAFSAVKPGQYLDAEPRSWVAAITGSKQP